MPVSKTKSVEVNDTDYDTSILCRQLWFIWCGAYRVESV